MDVEPRTAEDLAEVNGQVLAPSYRGRAPDDVPLTPRQAGVIARIIRALGEGSERAARLFVLLVASVLFATVALWRGIAIETRLIAVVLFAALVFAPMWWRTMFPKSNNT